MTPMRLSCCTVFAVAALALGPAQAASEGFWWDPSSPGSGVAVDVQGDVLAGIEVRATAAGTATVATFAGPLERSRSGGELPYTTIVTDTVPARYAIVGDGGSMPLQIERRFSVGVAQTVLERDGLARVLVPFAFGGAPLAAWSGRWLLQAEDADGAVLDLTVVFAAEDLLLDGLPARIGHSPDGLSMAVVVFDPSTGITSGVIEPAPRQPLLAFALFGAAPRDVVEGVSVVASASGNLIGPDRPFWARRLDDAPAVPAVPAKQGNALPPRLLHVLGASIKAARHAVSPP